MFYHGESEKWSELFVGVVRVIRSRSELFRKTAHLTRVGIHDVSEKWRGAARKPSKSALKTVENVHF